MSRRRRLVKRSGIFRRAGESIPATSTTTTAAEHSSNAAKTSAVIGTLPFQNSKSQSVLVYSTSTTAAAVTSAPSSSRTAARATTTATASAHKITTIAAPSKASNAHSSIAGTATAAAANNGAGSAGTISGGAIGAIVAIISIIIIGAIAYFFVRRRQKRAAMANNRLTRFSMGPTYNATATYNNSTRQQTAYHDFPSMSQAYQPPDQRLQQQQQQQQQHPTITIAAPVTVEDHSAAHEPMSATIITTPTGTNPEQDYWHQKPIGTYVVAAGYTPTLSDELEVRPGDHVQVLVEYDDGWCLGTNLTISGQARGVFPRQCLGQLAQTNIIPPSSSPDQSRHVDSTINNRLSSLYGNTPSGPNPV
ncbi:hypothetical protein BX666DRAFT_1974584 [Dichotomocladium elegans]|nr:hypothetical protein BX666DRAFT_1974584 [Dichotomocladium elegans]